MNLFFSLIYKEGEKMKYISDKPHCLINFEIFDDFKPDILFIGTSFEFSFLQKIIVPM